MSKLYYRSGKATIEMDDTIAASVRRVLDNVAPETTRELQRAADEIADSARAQWPVKTGKSKAGLVTGLRVTASAVESFIGNDVGYVYYIKGKGQGGKSTWVTLVRTPGRRLGRKLAVRLGDRLLKLASASAGGKVVAGGAVGR